MGVLQKADCNGSLEADVSFVSISFLIKDVQKGERQFCQGGLKLETCILIIAIYGR